MRPRVPYFVSIALVAAFGAAMGCGGGCGEPKPEQRPRVERGTGALMTCLALIRAHHRQADFHMELGDTDKAIGAINRILELTCPEQEPEVQEALLDAHSRLATLQLKNADIDGAERTVTTALKRFRQESFFMAHLLMVKADVMEARAKKLKEQGQEEQAKQLMRDAINVLSRSININRRLQTKLIKELEP